MTHPPHPVYIAEDDWQWLQARPGGASATIRRLVSDARGAGRRSTPTGPTRAERFYAEMARRGAVRPTRGLMEGWLTGPIAQVHLRAAGVSVDEFLAVWDAKHPSGGATTATTTTDRSTTGTAARRKRGAPRSARSSTRRKRSVGSPNELAAFVRGEMP